MYLLLAPEKIITSTAEENWINSGSKNIILLTAGDNIEYVELMKKWNGSIFKHIECFKKYASNDFISLRAIELAEQYKISKIIPMSEADILRAANLRKKLGLPGQDLESAILFRNKIQMKLHAKRHGIKIPRFKCIKDSVDIINFIEEVGYPVIVKPIMGRGSLSTFIISNKNELCEKLKEGFISDTCRYTDLLAEEFIEGEVYHLDGLYLNNQLNVISVSKYINNCLAFVNGNFLGSYTLSDSNPLKLKLINFGRTLLESVFVLPTNSLFHIEVFVDKNNEITLCEIACRLGGNGINDEVMMQQGVDIKMGFIRAECRYEGTDPTPFLSLRANISARVLIPPNTGKLLNIPMECNLDGVLRYQSKGSIGNWYKKMQMSNDEIANFLLGGETEAEIHEKISAVTNWFYQQVQWECL